MTSHLMSTNTDETCVRIERDSRGYWQVVSDASAEPLMCATLEEAREFATDHVAELAGEPGEAVELIVRDAYNRVLEHRWIWPSDGPRRSVIFHSAAVEARGWHATGTPVA